MKLERGKVLLERYEIIEQIGAGGMAIVYKANDLKLDRVVTVKVLREEFAEDEEFLARFNIEARSAAKLSNHNIVNVYDVGKQGDINFIIMEYIDGVTLKDLIIKRAPFENEEALGVAIQIAAALSFAHNNNIVHRDIKPQNIMVTKLGVVKVTDFGIARGADSKTTTTSSNAMGSVHYFSPEQARGKYVDHRSDIYSLGIVMFEMITGTLPYDGDSSVAVALKHINEDLPDMKAINPNVSLSVEKIILKATAKNVSLRYESADEMSNDLKRALSDEGGGFVDYAGSFLGSHTQRFKKEDRNEIENKAKQYISENEEFETEYDGYDDYDDYDGDYDDYDEEETLDKKTKLKIEIAAVCVAIAIIALISSIGLRIYNESKKAGNNAVEASYAPMIDLLGKTVEEAKEALEELDVEIGQVNEETDDKVEAGKIIAQYPEAGVDIAKKSIIVVTVSAGSDKIPVPDATKKVITDVYTIKEFAEGILIIDDYSEYSDDYPNHVVMRQEPESGTLVSPGSTIKLYVSRGKELKKTTVPDLLGQTEDKAKLMLVEAGLEIGQVSKGYSDDYPAGQVFKQSYDAEKEVNEGTSVTFIISQGPSPQKEPPEASQPPQTSDPQTSPGTVEVPAESFVPTKAISIPAPSSALEKGPVRVQVIKVSEGNTEVLFEKAGLLLSDFPLNLNVSGTQPFEIQIYVNGQLESRDSFDLG